MTIITYTLRLADGPGAVPGRAALLLEFKDPVRDTYRQATRVLDARHPQQTWEIDVDASGSAQAFHTSVLEYDGGARTVSVAVPFTGTEATIGEGTTPMVITVFASGIDWNIVSLIEFAASGASHTFSAAQPGAWCITLPDVRTVEWHADYQMADGSGTRRSGGITDSSALSLPPPPPPEPAPFEVEFEVTQASFSAFAVRSVELRATAPDGTVHTGQLSQASPDWRVPLLPSEDGSRWFVYDWTVNYTDNTPAWTASSQSAHGAQHIVLEDLGRILFDSSAIDFDVVTSIAISWSNGGTPKAVELSRGQPHWLLQPGKDYDRTQALFVGLTYTLATGSTNLRGEAVPQGRFQVPYPIQQRLIRLLAPGLQGSSPPYSQLDLSVSTLEQGTNWRLQSPARGIRLNQASSDWETSVAAVDPERTVLIYSGTATPSVRGPSKSIALTRSPFALTPVGPDIRFATVQISAQTVSWERYRRVEATLWTNSDSDKEDLQTFAFDRNSSDAWWAYPASAPAAPSFRWSAIYYPADGGEPQLKAAANGNGPQLQLPPVAA